MSRSRRQPYAFGLYGVNAKRGKQVTSRKFRRGARQRCHRVKYEWSVIHQDDMDDIYQGDQDRYRGYSGRRDWDYGWDYMGDGTKCYGGFLRPRPRWQYWWENPTMSHTDRWTPLSETKVREELRDIAKLYRK